MAKNAPATQVALFVEPTPSGRFDPATEEESASIGRALVSELRGQPMTDAQRLLLSRTRSSALAEERAPTPIVDVSETILTLPRHDDAEMRFAIRRYKGSSPYLDIRRWERTPEGMRPTKQGVTLRAREITQVLGALAQAARRFAGDD